MSNGFIEGLYKFNCKECNGEGRIENEKTGRLIMCKKCKGEGKIEVFVDKCTYCNGSMKVECDCTGGLGKDSADEDCYACGGAGEHRCPACDGLGFELGRLEDAGAVIFDNSFEDSL